ncbi:MAG TPA: MFS transporter, partial [Alkalispirochaeta sp.]|nr:MFS transporter [Alkalispirochaeta sp.]
MNTRSLFAPGPGRLLLIAASTAMFALGAASALYGPFFPYFSETLDLSPSRLGLLPGLHFAGATMGVLFGGMVARRVGYRRVLMTGAVVLTAGYGAVAVAWTWPLLQMGAALLGLGFGLLVNVNILVDEAFGEMGAAALQLVNALFSVGAIVAPLLAIFSLQFGGQTVAFGIGAVLAVILIGLLTKSGTSADDLRAHQHEPTYDMAAPGQPSGDGAAAAHAAEEGTSDTAVATSGTAEEPAAAAASAASAAPDTAAPDTAASDTAASDTAAAAAAKARHRRALILPTALFLPLYLLFPGTEASFANWMPTHLFSLLPAAVASAVVSGYWITFTVGRLVAVPISMRIRPGTMVGGAILLALLATVAATVDSLAPAAYLVAGLAMGPVFPGGLSWLRRRYPERAGEVGSIIIAAGGIGGMIIPPAIGYIVEARGVSAIAVTLAVLLAGSVLLATIIGISGRTQGSAPT